MTNPINAHPRPEVGVVMQPLDALGDLVVVLQEADPNDKAEVYSQMGLRLTYFPQKQPVEAQVSPGLHMCNWFVSEGGLEPFAYLTAQGDPWLDLD